MLSNTAVPKYYGEFRRQVLRGDIPVCSEISAEMNRIDRRIADPAIFYTDNKVEGFIAFCENEMTTTDGGDIKMLPSFSLWAEQLYGWKYYEKVDIFDPNEDGKFRVGYVLRPLITKLYLIVARGAAKTMFLAFVQAYELVMSGKAHQLITTASTMRQSDEVLRPIRIALMRSPGPLFKFLTRKGRSTKYERNQTQAVLAATKNGVSNFLTGSTLTIRPMSVDKMQGLSSYCTTVDEWLSGVIREDVIGAVEQGATKLPEYKIVAASSEGTVRGAAGDNIKIELAKILSGEYDAPHTAIFHYKLDSIHEVGNPTMWIKANPNIGLVVSYEAYRRDVDRAEAAPASRNDILAKRFSLPMAGYTYFFTYEETLAGPPSNYDGMSCALGIDLSQGDDFCAFTYLFPLPNGAFGIKSLAFITQRKFHSLTPAGAILFQTFMDEGSLIVLEGTVLNMHEVYEEFETYTERHNFMINTMGYDPYNAESFIKDYTAAYSEYFVHKVRQGARTETVPLGELKSMTEHGDLHFDQQIITYAMGNAMVVTDTNGNMKLYKRRYEDKIDQVSALINAYVAYKIDLMLF